MTDGKVTIQVRGAWQGEVENPARVFQGTITGSEHAALPRGAAAQVQYQGSGSRVPNPAEHGAYTLYVGGRRWTLMRFSLPPSRGGGVRHDDRLENDWEADVLLD